MSDLNDKACLVNTDILVQIREAELLKIHKLELILSIIKQSPVQKFNIPEKANLQKTIKIFSVQNFLKLDNDLTLLGLDSCKSIDISYTERKAILNYVKEEIPNRCTPIVNYMIDMQKTWPDILKKEQKHDEIIVLEEKRQKLHEQLSVLKNEKCSLLKYCAELKMGPYLKNELNMRYSNYKLNQIKANVLKGLLLHEFCSSTDQTMKAIKEISNYIEEELKE